MKDALETKSNNKLGSIGRLSYSIIHPYDDTSMPILTVTGTCCQD